MYTCKPTLLTGDVNKPKGTWLFLNNNPPNWNIKERLAVRKLKITTQYMGKESPYMVAEGTL